MFQAPHPAEGRDDPELKGDLAVIRVREHSKTLDTLLRFCYPCALAEDPELEVLKDLVDVLVAARNYSLKAIERKVLQALSNPKILEVEPLRCFAIARHGSAHQETLLAARYTLALPLVPSCFQDINLITTADLLALLTYRQKCGDAVYVLRDDLSWINSHYASKYGCPWLPESEKSKFGSTAQRKDCRCAKAITPTFKPFGLQPFKWWDDFMVETFVALREKPCRATVESFTEKAVQSVRAQGCPSCTANIANHMLDCTKLMTEKVEKVVSKVQMNLRLP